MAEAVNSSAVKAGGMATSGVAEEAFMSFLLMRGGMP